MSTVRDVARHAGVSVGTVSKVLSNDTTVKQALRERVHQAVSDLGYRPNRAARALRTKKINILGLVVPDITNPFFAQLAKGIETEAAERGHTVILTNSHDDPATEERQIEALIEQSPRGLIVVASPESNRASATSGVPILSLDRRFADCPLVSTDHFAGSAKMAQHLFELGHRRIAYLSGPRNAEVSRLRLSGFVTRMDALGTVSDPVELTAHEGAFDYESGERLARRLLAPPPSERPTAIATASDQMAIGVLRAATDMGLSVPAELSVAGFDDITLAALVVPRLTTVAQPTDALARNAVTQLLCDGDAALSDVSIEGELVIRDSTARVL